MFIKGIIIGLFIGGGIGFILAALCNAAKKGDEQGCKKKDTEYRCKNNIFKACKDTCCVCCLGASECKYSCGADPADCGQSVIR
jgi:hypothetical protein